MENLTDLETLLPLTVKELILKANKSEDYTLTHRCKLDGEEYKVHVISDDIGVKEIIIKLRSKDRTINGANIWEPQ